MTIPIKGLLKPIIRLCLKHAFKFQEFLELTKQVFIEVAREEIHKQGAAVNTSRLSASTGLQRKDIARLTATTEETPGKSNLLMRIIGQWQKDAKFASKQGKAKLLSFEGNESQFAKLVRMISTDLNHYTVLFELERVGAVVRRGNKIKLQNDVYVPSNDRVEGFSLLSADCSDLISAVEENVLGSVATPHLHVKTQYDNVCIDSLPRIREWFLDQGARFHKEAREYLSMHDKDLNPRLYKKNGKARVAVITFSFIERPK